MLLLPTQSYNSLIREAIEGYPVECCGFLLGKENGDNRIVTKVMVCKNVSTSYEKEFLILPEEYKKAEKEADEKALKLLGVYHSHPNWDAVPSGKDVQNAFPYFSYLIISVFKNKISSARSWRLDDTFALKEEPIICNQNSIQKSNTNYGNDNNTYTFA